MGEVPNLSLEKLDLEDRVRAEYDPSSGIELEKAMANLSQQFASWPSEECGAPKLEGCKPLATQAPPDLTGVYKKGSPGTQKLVFIERDSRQAHTIFAPLGDKAEPVFRMGLITVSRIAKAIILVFDLVENLAYQLGYLSDVQFYTKEIYAVLVNYYLLTTGEDNARVSRYTEEIRAILK